VPFVNDPTITDDDQLLRRVPECQWVEDGAGGWRPSSAAFNDIELSVDIASTLHALNEPITAPLRGHDGYALVAISAGLARQHDQAVCRDPLHTNPAHGIVYGKKTNGTRKQLAKNSAWVVPPPG
jgi:hypothetical protein